MRGTTRGVLVCVCLLAACGKGDTPPPPTVSSGIAQESGPNRGASHTSGGRGAVNPQTEGGKLFLELCARCHGEDGTGRTEIANVLAVKPRNYTDPAWQATVSDDDLRRIIVLGGAKVGKSNLMPDNPKLKDRPDVVNELVGIIRSFAKK
ncbi:MAG: c-type cytochrome [Kofleriaceae bacterium]